MRNRYIILIPFFMLISCAKHETSIVELNDDLISQADLYFEKYYLADDIDGAANELLQLLDLAREFETKGTKVSPILWEAYFRLADIYQMQGDHEKSSESANEAIVYFKQLDQFFRSDNLDDIELMASVLSEMDMNRGAPRWKKESDEGLF